MIRLLPIVVFAVLLVAACGRAIDYQVAQAGTLTERGYALSAERRTATAVRAVPPRRLTAPRSVSLPSVRAIRHVFPRSTEGAAIRVARCESRLNPRAIGRAGERSIFQIHPVHFWRVVRSRAGRIYVDPRRLTDSVYASRVAYVLSVRGTNWRPWTCKP